MPDAELTELLENYLAGQHIMQLATAVNGRPWCCTVYYVHDNEHNLYWASVPARRHSQELNGNNRAAVAIPIKFDKGEPVIGIQAEGVATLLAGADEIRMAAERYAEKFKRSQDWIDDITSARTEHRLYKFMPEAMYLFDEVNFPGGGGQRQRVT